MASFVKYYCFTEHLADKQHNLSSDSLNIALTNTAPTLTHTTLSQITEISNGNGYTSETSGAVTLTGHGQHVTSGTFTLSQTAEVVFTASTGTIGPFRYAVLYNNTHASNYLIGYWDYGSNVTLQDGETFTVDLATNFLSIA